MSPGRRWVTRMKKIFWWLSFLAWLLAVLWLSLTPKPPQIENGLLGWDKFQHAAAYALLTLLAGRVFSLLPARSRKYNPWRLALLAAALFGISMELLQGAMGLGRTPDVMDFVADCVGACTVLAVARLWLSRHPREKDHMT